MNRFMSEFINSSKYRKMLMDTTNLVGRKIEELYVGPEEADLILVLDNGDICRFDTEGDCFSESWWADIVGVKQLLNHTITSIDEVDMPIPKDDRTRQDEDEAYCYKIKTDGGECDLIFRNSSNGYYGGYASMEWVNNFIIKNYRQITEDWRA